MEEAEDVESGELVEFVEERVTAVRRDKREWTSCWEWTRRSWVGGGVRRRGRGRGRGRGRDGGGSITCVWRRRRAVLRLVCWILRLPDICEHLSE